MPYIAQDEFGNTFLIPTQQELFAQQFKTMAYQVMSLSVFSTALGMIVGAVGVETAIPLAQITATDPAVEELRKAYGDVIVSKALKDVPEANAVELAHKVEFYVEQDLRKRYGDWAANIALNAAPPGDLSTAIEIAKTLSERQVTRDSTPAQKVQAVARGKMRGRHKAEPVKDTKTGISYPSKGAAAKAVAAEYGLRPDDTFSWYAIIKRDPKRFVAI
jgi:hypothetical protein